MSNLLKITKEISAMNVMMDGDSSVSIAKISKYQKEIATMLTINERTEIYNVIFEKCGIVPGVRDLSDLALSNLYIGLTK